MQAGVAIVGESGRIDERISATLDAKPAIREAGIVKATIEIPDDLYRRVKAKSALEGRAVREVTIELYQRWIAEGIPAPSGQQTAEWLDEFLSHTIPADLPGPTAREILEDSRLRLETGKPA